MLYLRVNETPDESGLYNVWFDLDAKHETFIKVDRFTDMKDIFGQIYLIKGQYKKGLLAKRVLVRIKK